MTTSLISVEIHGEAAIAYIRGLKDRLHQGVFAKVVELSIRLQTMVKGKLSGPVLHTRTGTLRRSINRVVLDEGDHILAQVGTNVVYARPHEYGFDGIVSVRAYARKQFAPGADDPRGAAKRSKRVATGGVTEVRAHFRHMHMPERSFLRSSLTDMQSEIIAEIKSAAKESLK